jgi:hypothetical protein
MKKLGSGLIVFLLIVISNPAFAQVDNSSCCNNYKLTTVIGYANPGTAYNDYNWAIGLSPVGIMVEKYGNNDSSWILDVKPNYQSALNIFDYMFRVIFGAVFGIDPGPLYYSESISLSYKKAGLFNRSSLFYRAGVEVFHIKSPGYSNEVLPNLTMGYEWKRGHSVLGMELGYDSMPINFWYKYRF